MVGKTIPNACNNNIVEYFLSMVPKKEGYLYQMNLKVSGVFI